MAQRREPTREEIIEKISAAVGLRGPEKFLVPSKVEGAHGYSLTSEEWEDFRAGRGPAWEEEQRRIRERDQKQSTADGMEEMD